MSPNTIAEFSVFSFNFMAIIFMFFLMYAGVEPPITPTALVLIFLGAVLCDAGLLFGISYVLTATASPTELSDRF